ncbi:hypothetical protein JGI9_00161 [Candidatus Kryptonium thompsonii]|nr:hypothetical protein JGI9_00161 [Candidatus Kryptonium thompsoni]
MERILQKWEKFQDTPLNLKSRIALLISVLFLLAVFFFPLWRMQFFATFYPDGLKLYIYSYKLEGGKTAGRDDLREINTLNHYIGMKPLSQSDFPEFTYLPFVSHPISHLVSCSQSLSDKPQKPYLLICRLLSLEHSVAQAL